MEINDENVAKQLLAAQDGLLAAMDRRGIKKTAAEYKKVVAFKEELINDNPILQE